MNLLQMKTLVPLIEAHVQEQPPALQNPLIHEHELVLDDLTPFSVPAPVRGHAMRDRQFWVLDHKGALVRDYVGPGEL